jgi:hypothetical protein
LALFLRDTGDGRIKPVLQGGFIEVSGKGPILELFFEMAEKKRPKK